MRNPRCPPAFGSCAAVSNFEPRQQAETTRKMDLLEQFKSFIKANNLLPDGRSTLLAVSGGVDSVVMAHLFREAGYPFGIAHCNFQLRGAASDGDELFVQQLAAEYGVLFFAKHFETKTYAEQHGLSVQMAARALRYDWFHEIAAEHGFARIATAHNLNDSVETALLNFVRGTGLSGLGGIAVNAAGRIRPILFAARPEIEHYARAHQLDWSEDSSNATDDYARNFIRHQVVPRLEELNPNFLHTAERNLHRLRETDENLRFLQGNYFGEKTTAPSEFIIDKQKLAQLPAPKQVLHEMLKPCGFTSEQARQLADSLDHVGLELYSNAGWRVLNDREKILIVPPQSSIPSPQSPIPIVENDLMVRLPDGSKLVLMPTDIAAPFPDGRDTILVGAEKLRFPLHLRPWLPGDAFQPFGMGGHSQKLQDFFTNLKLSRLEKEKVWVLENGDGTIIWVLGYRLDERYKVVSETGNFLKISILMPTASRQK